MKNLSESKKERIQLLAGIEITEKNLEEGAIGKALTGLALGSALAFGSPSQSSAQQIKPSHPTTQTQTNLNDINSQVQQIEQQASDDKVILYVKLLTAFNKTNTKTTPQDRRKLADAVRSSSIKQVSVEKDGKILYSDSLKNFLDYTYLMGRFDSQGMNDGFDSVTVKRTPEGMSLVFIVR